jgi:hypothetical protein
MATRRFADFRGLFAVLTALSGAACSGDHGPAIGDPQQGPAGPAEPPSDPPPAAPAPPGATDAVLRVSVDGTGRVVSTPAGIDCPGRCTAAFAIGARVELVATPAEGWKLTSWSGGCSGSGACEIVLDAARDVKGALALIDARWDPSVGAADCADAWGKSGEKLSPCDTTKDDYVVVRKSKRNTALCKSGKLVKNFRSGLGFAPVGDKVKEGDGKTPEGVFYIPRLVPDSDYHKAFLLSYPAADDAKRGAASGLITNAQRDQILSQHAACAEPNQETKLGGVLEIHGNGSSDDWTKGCIAVEDSVIDQLWSAVGVRDTIVVLP